MISVLIINGDESEPLISTLRPVGVDCPPLPGLTGCVKVMSIREAPQWTTTKMIPAH